MDDISRRLQLAKQAGQHFGGNRDLYEVLGYPRDVDVNMLASMYERGDIAARIVDAYPDATWRKPPEVTGAIAEEWRALEARLNLWRVLHRLDRLANIGHYGVLFLGLDGGEPPSEPAERTDYRLMYAQPHSERTAQITAWEDDPSNPRYGMPKMYRITTGVNWTGAGAGKRDLNVHHSRVVHVAERAMEDPAIGTPRLMRVVNRLMDLDKMAGGSAEMYWQNVAMLLAFIAEGDQVAEWSPETKQEQKQQIDEMMHGLRRTLRLSDVRAEQLAPGLQGADPAPVIDSLMDLIAGSEGIPKRILLGSEAGELASSQDENSWESRVDERKEQHAAPGIVEPLLSKLQWLGCLSRGEFKVEWPESATMSDEKRAEVANTKAGALKAYMSTPGAERIVDGNEFREWLGMDPAEAEPMDDVDETDPEMQAQFGRLRPVKG